MLAKYEPKQRVIIGQRTCHPRQVQCRIGRLYGADQVQVARESLLRKCLFRRHPHTHIYTPFCYARARARQDGAITKVQDENTLMLKEYQERTFTPEALAYYDEHPFGGKALILSLFIIESLEYCYYQLLKYRVRQHWPGRGDFPSGYFLSQLFKFSRLLDQVVHHSQRGGYHS